MRSADERCVIGTSQGNLAWMLGVRRPTLNKELQALAETGAIMALKPMACVRLRACNKAQCRLASHVLCYMRDSREAAACFRTYQIRPNAGCSLSLIRRGDGSARSGSLGRSALPISWRRG